jgi:hypothetical protein
MNNQHRNLLVLSFIRCYAHRGANWSHANYSNSIEMDCRSKTRKPLDFKDMVSVLCAFTRDGSAKIAIKSLLGEPDRRSDGVMEEMASSYLPPHLRPLFNTPQALEKAIRQTYPAAYTEFCHWRDQGSPKYFDLTEERLNGYRPKMLQTIAGVASDEQLRDRAARLVERRSNTARKTSWQVAVAPAGETAKGIER